jgi:hypothetical protein
MIRPRVVFRCTSAMTTCAPFCCEWAKSSPSNPTWSTPCPQPCAVTIAWRSSFSSKAVRICAAAIVLWWVSLTGWTGSLGTGPCFSSAGATGPTTRHPRSAPKPGELSRGGRPLGRSHRGSRGAGSGPANRRWKSARLAAAARENYDTRTVRVAADRPPRIRIRPPARAGARPTWACNAYRASRPRPLYVYGDVDVLIMTNLQA